MTDRAHQSATRRIAREIAAGAPIRRVYESVTPGGGKSRLPGILLDELAPDVADRILWVAPRDALRAQGEADFPESSRYRIRAARNEADPCRGTQGYITTYQSIIADPGRHLETLSSGRWILFLDEPHHVLAGGAWDQALAPLVDRARLVVYASGTFARGDGQPIAGLEYGPDGLPALEGETVVRYSRGDALREGAIVPVHFQHIDGRAEWEDEQGEVREVDSLTGRDYAAPALFTALRTGYALELLDETVAHWLQSRREAYPAGKLLVVAPDIKTAGDYLDHLRARGLDALMAASDDSPAAADAIARFKGLTLPSTDILVTVAMAYEGMSVPAVDHIACLTHIRSVPWLEQCFARANRTAPGKRESWIFGPADPRFREAIRMIEAEQAQALREVEERGEASERPEGEDVEGPGRPRIVPIGSSAYRDHEPELFTAASRPDGGLTPSQAEAQLRSNIDKHIKVILDATRPGSAQAKKYVIYKSLRLIVGDKAREECSVEELAKQWAYLKERWPV
jgi:superfamily II DNA or RNA helicase